MFLNYRIYRLETKIKDTERLIEDVKKGHSFGEDVDAQAYIREISKKLLQLGEKLDRLRAERYERRLNAIAKSYTV